MESGEFKAEVSGLPGYAPSLAVEILTLNDAFPSLG